MSNIKKLKETLDNDFNKQKNYQKVVKRMENNRNYNIFLKYCFIPIGVIMIIFIGYNRSNNSHKLSDITEEMKYETTSSIDNTSTNDYAPKKETNEHGDTDDLLPSKEYINMSYSSSKTCKKNKYYRKDITIYTYCLSDIKINNIELKSYLNTHGDKETINTLINELKEESVYKDGGSKLYREEKPYNISKEGISILKCNTLDGNKDIYIGPINMRYESDFCK